jgi:uncharacterized membrane protein YidH (DUF202 family)
MKRAGLVLVIIGALLTIFSTVTFFTKEKVVDIGKLEITADKPHRITWSPLIGIGVLVVGGVVMLASKNR